MKRFRTLYIIEHSDYFFGTLHVCASTKKATLRYFKVIEGIVSELGDNDPYNHWKNSIESVLHGARKIADENNFVLWTY
jgi:hypothetical protein